MVALLNGTVVFLADLIRGLEIPVELDFLRVSSYRNGRVSGKLVASGNLKVNIRGRHVILVDDILDTGRTMNHVIASLQAEGPQSIRICALLDKRSRRVVPVEADYAGFEVPDCFVVGYGLDFAERYRNLPFVGVLQDRVFKKRGD
jgi:hypoxanthine phosphoribosyltransferase